MSDSEDFAGNETNDADKDPVADFLMREQTQLAQLDENFEGFSSDNAKMDSEEFNSSVGYGITTSGTDREGSSPSLGFDSCHHYGQTEDQYGVIKQQDCQRQEPEKIKKWREEQKERLLKKDAESEKKKAEWREMAKRELDDWYRHREELLEKAKKANRESQESFVEDRDEKKPGADWERICRLCDFNPKGSRNVKDVSRLRSILLQLKQLPAEQRQ